MMVFLSLAVIILVFAGLLGYLVFMLEFAFVGHDFATSKEAISKIGEILRIFNQENSRFYDFGSARGGMAVGLSKICPELQILGIDSSRLRTWEARIWSALNFSQAGFACQNINGADISGADIVYIYQNQINTDALELKLQNELKPGALVITNTQSFAHWPPKQIFVVHDKKPAYEKLFVYINR